MLKSVNQVSGMTEESLPIREANQNKQSCIMKVMVMKSDSDDQSC